MRQLQQSEIAAVSGGVLDSLGLGSVTGLVSGVVVPVVAGLPVVGPTLGPVVSKLLGTVDSLVTRITSGLLG